MMMRALRSASCIGKRIYSGCVAANREGVGRIATLAQSGGRSRASTPSHDSDVVSRRRYASIALLNRNCNRRFRIAESTRSAPMRWARMLSQRGGCLESSRRSQLRVMHRPADPWGCQFAAWMLGASCRISTRQLSHPAFEDSHHSFKATAHPERVPPKPASMQSSSLRIVAREACFVAAPIAISTWPTLRVPP